MGYDIHITRADNWAYDQNPITLDDVRKIMPKLSGRFRIDETGVITTEDRTFSGDFGPYLEYMDEEGRKTYIVFGERQCPSFKFGDFKQLLALCELAEALDARLQGDEDEFYDRPEIKKQMAAQRPQDAGNPIKLRKSRGIVIFLYVLVAIIWICIIGMIVFGFMEEGRLEEGLLNGAIFTVFNIFLTTFACAIGRWKLVFDGEGVTFTPMFGAKKGLTYLEIQRITIGQGYVIYDSSGRKWVAFGDDSDGAARAISLMKAKGVRVDLF